MSEMVERVARAIEIEMARAGIVDDRLKVDAASAAIRAMREPTESMMAAVDCAGEKKQWISGQAWIAGWQAMIDECLKQ